MLIKKTGVACGARYGANAVNQPTLLSAEQRARSVQGLTRYNKFRTDANQSLKEIDPVSNMTSLPTGLS